MPTTEDHQRMLRGAMLRVTRPRLAVLRSVQLHAHADTETILVAVHQQSPDISRQAVYDSLHTLADAGLIRRIQPAGSVTRYESRTGDNHHHMVCRSCGVIVDVDCAIGKAPCLNPSAGKGFSIHEAEVTYWGLCAGCSATAPPSVQTT
jgi:Fe2+ or Zn2+ uptake regulation protein